MISPFYAQSPSIQSPILNRCHTLGLDFEIDDDAKSEASSCDSAVDLYPRDFIYAQSTTRNRKYSIDPLMTEPWEASVPTRVELIARCLDTHLDISSPVSDKWSESCISLDDSLMSPCSSLSNYSETDIGEFPSGATFLHPLSKVVVNPQSRTDMLEAKARSRENFQALVTRWEHKQVRQQQQQQQHMYEMSRCPRPSPQSPLPISGLVHRYVLLQKEDGCIDRSFHELRTKWEQKQTDQEKKPS